MGRHEGVIGTLILTCLATGCSDGAGPDLACDGAIVLAHGSCMVFEDQGRLAAYHDRIEAVVRQALEQVHSLMPVEEVRIRILAGPGVIPELGIGGFAPEPDQVQLTFDPDSPRMEPSLATQLLPMIGHELHHVMRHRTVGYGGTLWEAMVSEGLADHFSMELAGIDPPMWSTALTAPELETWTPRARETGSGSYDHARWFFGQGGQVPRWAGYAIGFQVVDAFLAAHPDRRPSDLFDEPAGSFR